MKRLIGALILVSLSAGLTFGQKKSDRPRVDIPPVYRGTPPGPIDPNSIANTKWFDVFKDEKLRELIDEAIRYNYDLREALAHVDEAAASVGITRSEQFPQFGASADLTTERRSRDGVVTLPEPIKRDRTFGSVLLNLFTFELDVWGRLRKQTKAARADLAATDELRKAVLTTIISDVATAYFNLRELDFELDVARRTLLSRNESLRIIKLRQGRGVSTMLEVRQAEELVYSASEVIPALEQAIEQQENFISYLT